MAGCSDCAITVGLIAGTPHGSAVGVFCRAAGDWEVGDEVLIPQIDSIFGHSYTARLV
jgi:hypothetical protein